VSKILTKFLLVLTLITGISYGIEQPSHPQESTDNVQAYRCELAFNYMYLIGINNRFGDVLLSGDLINIFLASNAVVDALDEMKKELESMDIPKQIKEPYDVYLESIKAYRKSAEYISQATNILLGYHEGSEVEIRKLMDKSDNYVFIANKYLGLSIVLHGEAFGVKSESHKECDKYAGNIFNQYGTGKEKS